MDLKPPDKLNRRAVKNIFTKLHGETWEYLFDHEKENGLCNCRTKGWGVKKAWYATTLLVDWLIDHGYYLPTEFDKDSWPIKNDQLSEFQTVRRSTWLAA